MLIVNNLLDSRTVRLGLMNGAPGHVVAIVANEVGLGLPQFVVVGFPEYRSAPFWEDHPTWVPVGPERRQSKKSPKRDRVQLPLKLASALTIHKAQGLTCPEVVADLSSSSPTRESAASPGLALWR